MLLCNSCGIHLVTTNIFHSTGTLNHVSRSLAIGGDLGLAGALPVTPRFCNSVFSLAISSPTTLHTFFLLTPSLPTSLLSSSASPLRALSFASVSAPSVRVSLTLCFKTGLWLCVSNETIPSTKQSSLSSPPVTIEAELFNRSANAFILPTCLFCSLAFNRILCPYDALATANLDIQLFLASDVVATNIRLVLAFPDTYIWNPTAAPALDALPSFTHRLFNTTNVSSNISTHTYLLNLKLLISTSVKHSPNTYRSHSGSIITPSETLGSKSIALDPSSTSDELNGIPVRL
ncbi:hypothetical protein AX774_g341 [Zancudomyces culisetae]|uniref:Uncharacterized protein n=1 Tax=Zancudomyces culisetae TaxID=1213189 RepID=A0A1R1PYV6_ZANCU|nr:hypothetical protein AX774_g341 [Zancudomyces culisetae]|eukprot:OMH86111.1 hypothetical protein AX774_g341 [Zancudomyces culisetae]